jgi:hypothetical protein
MFARNRQPGLWVIDATVINSKNPWPPQPFMPTGRTA